MKVNSYLLGLSSLMIGLSSANPAPIPKGTAFTATFDDIPGSAVDPELDLIPNGYRNLAWNGFDDYKTTISLVKAQSGTQVAANFIGENVVQLKETNITSKYPGSKTQFFDLASLFQGCVIASQTGVLIEPCTLEYTGHKASGKSSPVTHQCTYSGGTSLASCTFPSNFKGVDTVSIAFTNVVQSLTTVILLDDVKGTTYQ